MEQPYYERLASLESEVKSIQKQNDRIETKLDVYASNFATKSEVKDMFELRDKEIAEIKNNKRANISLTISGLSLIVLLLFNVLNYVK